MSLQLILFPEVLYGEIYPNVGTHNMNNKVSKGVLVALDIKATKVVAEQAIYDNEKGTFSGSLKVENIPFKRVKDGNISTILNSVNGNEFSSVDAVRRFVETLQEAEPRITDIESPALQSVIEKPSTGEKTIVVKGSEEKPSLSGKKPEVTEEKKEPSKERVVQSSPEPKKETKPQSSSKSPFKPNKKGQKGEFKHSTKDLSQLGALAKALGDQEAQPKDTPKPKVENKVPPAPKKKEETLPSKMTQKVVKPQKETQEEFDNKELVDLLNERSQDTVEQSTETIDPQGSWPGGAVIQSAEAFYEKGYFIGASFKPGDKVNHQALINGTPKRGNDPVLMLVFPDEGKAKFYFEGASKHPKLKGFVSMCTVKKLSVFKDKKTLKVPSLLVSDPKKYLEYIGDMG